MEAAQTLSQRIAEVRSQEKLIHSTSKELDSTCWTDFYFVVYFTEPNQPTLYSLYGDDSEEEEFNICCDKYRDGKVAQKCRSLKLFDIEHFNMNNIEKPIKHFHTFLNYSFPDSVYNLNVSCRHASQNKKLNIFKSIIRISPKIRNSACFEQLCLNESQFKRLIAAYRHVHNLTFRRCNLFILNPLDLSTAFEDTKIERLSLVGSGLPCSSSWGTNLYMFKNLIVGLETSNALAKTLKVLDFRFCGIEESKAKGLLAQSSLSDKIYFGK
ncbi:unnamed protein product [Moneuplotes crassus]|uniref:Uncharacterized protein n=1 Tax=Euplotes crassus TaxID=5936 RepID=A0AAD1XFU8_EUPCR|nr:unnamed protein product [Moneuplotes crassus]